MNSHPQTLSQRLEAAGYFSDLNEEQADELRADIEANGYSGVFSHPLRFAMVDAEELAEGGVAEWLQTDVAPVLASRNIPLGSIEGQYPDDGSGQLVVVNEEEHRIWSEAELRSHDGAWGLSVVRAFELVNLMLERAGAVERLYAVGGGNDGSALLLTPEQARILQETNIPKREQPYIPWNEPERYGQPH